MSGRKPNPGYERYYEAGFDGGVYLVEFGPYVKVGRAQVFPVRLKALHCVAAKAGHALGRFCIFRGFAGNEYGAEARCINAIAARAVTLPSRREYFSGVTLDEAAAIVRSVLGAAAVMQTSITTRALSPQPQLALPCAAPASVSAGADQSPAPAQPPPISSGGAGAVMPAAP